jgi:L-2-hydroxyglutarate oxidase LhgO
MRVHVEQAIVRGIAIRCDARVASARPDRRQLRLESGDTIGYGHVINTAGLHADTIAHQFGVGLRYTLLPFKGLYWKLDPNSGIRLHHLVYPVPDLRVPFLGVHSTTTIDGQTYLGPTAVPAFGRENYHGLQGVSAGELLRVTGRVALQLLTGRDGFRELAWQEGRRYFKPWFLQAARTMLPRLRREHLQPTSKVGIRAQMLDRTTGKLVTDFVVERGPASTHVLNAISPAWTCSFPFARLVCDEYILAA